MEIVLEAKAISKTYQTGKVKVEALKESSIQFTKGTYNVIVGKSGSGKSTLLHLLSGLDTPTTGEVYLENQNINELNDDELSKLRREKIGFVFQFYNLLMDLTVYENIVIGLHLNGQKEDEAYILELLEILGLTDKKDVMPYELSGGQQQRVAIARALANKPAVIFADEPTGNLDAKSGQNVIDLLRMTKHKYNQTIILVTHDLNIAKNAERLITIEDGNIVTDSYYAK